MENGVVRQRGEIELWRGDIDPIKIEDPRPQEIAPEKPRKIGTLQLAITRRSVMRVNIAFERAHLRRRHVFDFWVVVGMDQYIEILATIDMRKAPPPTKQNVANAFAIEIGEELLGSRARFHVPFRFSPRDHIHRRFPYSLAKTHAINALEEICVIGLA